MSNTTKYVRPSFNDVVEKFEQRQFSKEKWLLEIEKEFNNQTPEQLGQLLKEAEEYCSQVKEITDNVQKIYNIIGVIKKKQNISFNQWKAIKAELKLYNNPIKKLN